MKLVAHLAKPFRFRTYKICKANRLSFQHLHNPLGSVDSKAASTLLFSAVTSPALLTSLESALTEKRGDTYSPFRRKFSNFSSCSFAPSISCEGPRSFVLFQQHENNSLCLNHLRTLYTKRPRTKRRISRIFISLCTLAKTMEVVCLPLYSFFHSFLPRAISARSAKKRQPMFRLFNHLRTLCKNTGGSIGISNQEPAGSWPFSRHSPLSVSVCYNKTSRFHKIFYQQELTWH